MAKLEKTITIHAPVEKVFTYMTQPEDLLEIWPSFVDVRDVQPLPNGGHHFHWVYKMAGMRFEGDSDDTEFVLNERVVSHTKGGIESTIAWRFEPHNGDTQVTFDSEYHVPVPLLGKLAEAFIVKQNEHEAETILANLKDRMEA